MMGPAVSASSGRWGALTVLGCSRRTGTSAAHAIAAAQSADETQATRHCPAWLPCMDMIARSGMRSMHWAPGKGHHPGPAPSCATAQLCITGPAQPRRKLKQRRGGLPRQRTSHGPARIASDSCSGWRRRSASLGSHTPGQQRAAAACAARPPPDRQHVQGDHQGQGGGRRWAGHPDGPVGQEAAARQGRGRPRGKPRAGRRPLGRPGARCSRADPRGGAQVGGGGCRGRARHRRRCRHRRSPRALARARSGGGSGGSSGAAAAG